MTNAYTLKSMTDEQLASFFSDLITDQDWVNHLYLSVCKDTCPISGQQCLVHQYDDWCQYSLKELFLQWLKTESD